MVGQVKSKLAILSSYTDATDGLITHGWITKIEKHGCFVHFYNGVQGFAPRLVLKHLSYIFFISSLIFPMRVKPWLYCYVYNSVSSISSFLQYLV